MWYAATVTTAPAGLVVAVADVKTRLRVDTADDDASIQGLIEETAQEAESYCNLFLRRQTLDIVCDCWADLERLPVGPVPAGGINSIGYTDPDGNAQTVAVEDYELRLIGLKGLEAQIKPVYGLSWPSIQTGSRITIGLDAGYDALPLDVRLAIYERIAERYENRETRAAGSFSSWDAMLINYRRGI